MSKLNIIIATIALIALVIGINVWHKTGGLRQPVGVHAQIISPPKNVDSFSLLNSKGKPFNNNSLWANWTMIVFGSASHPSEKLMQTMRELNKVVAMAEKDKQTPMPKVVFVSTDVVNDSLEKIDTFVTKINPDFVGLTGDPKQIAVLTQNLPANKSAMLLVDPSGKLSGIFAEPNNADFILHDFQVIVQNEG